MSGSHTQDTLHGTERSGGEHAIIYEYYCLNARNHYMGLIQTETVRSLGG